MSQSIFDSARACAEAATTLVRERGIPIRTSSLGTRSAHPTSRENAMLPLLHSRFPSPPLSPQHPDAVDAWVSLGRVLSSARLPGGGDSNPFAEQASGAYQRALTLSGGTNAGAQLGLAYYKLR